MLLFSNSVTLLVRFSAVSSCAFFLKPSIAASTYSVVVSIVENVELIPERTIEAESMTKFWIEPIWPGEFVIGITEPSGCRASNQWPCLKSKRLKMRIPSRSEQ